MKKINEQTKSFLLYGIEDVIKPKEIYKLDGAILFLVFLFFFLDEVVVDVPDKLITLIVVFFILKGLPNKLTTLYEANSEIETLD